MDKLYRSKYTSMLKPGKFDYTIQKIGGTVFIAKMYPTHIKLVPSKVLSMRAEER